MKFALIAILACIVLAVVNANSSVELDDNDFELINNKLQSHELDEFSIINWIKHLFSKFYKSLKLTLRTLKGVNCSIKSVMDIHDTALSFPSDLTSCGGIITKQLKAVLNGVNNVLASTTNILNYKNTICLSVNDEDLKKSSPCYQKMLSTMWDLYTETEDVVSNANNVKPSTDASGQCVQNVLDNLKSKFTYFPKNVLTCSKLVK